MNIASSQLPDIAQDRFGLRVAARLSDGTDELSHDISERLRVARQQAVARRKVVRVAQGTYGHRGAATLSLDDDRLGVGGRLAAVLPLLALVVGLVVINVVQNEFRAEELAEIDAALLTDDLPPAAYADPGFLQFVKTGGQAEN